MAPRPSGTASWEDERGAGHKGRVLAEAVPGHVVGRDRHPLLEGSQQRDPGREDGGLLDLGPQQFFFGPFEAELREREAERGIRRVEHLARGGRHLVGIPSHPHFL
jgi:hypothetical protein